MEIKRLYAVVDERGRRLHSHRSIAKMFGISETTVQRVLGGFGAFMAIPDPKTELQMAEDAAASLRKVLAMQAADKEAQQAKEQADVKPDGPREVIDPISGKAIKLPY
jgi:DNA-binding transcriptional regulator YhcF (GntR family)